MDGASVQNRKRPPFLWWTQSITRVCGQGTECRLAFGPLCVIQLGLTLQGSPEGGEAAKMLTEKRAESECRRGEQVQGKMIHCLLVPSQRTYFRIGAGRMAEPTSARGM